MKPLRDKLAIRNALDDMFDMPIIRHGFLDYSRDYEIVWCVPTNAQSADRGGTYTYRFRACVEANYTSAVGSGILPLNDVFIDYQRWLEAGEPDGFVWGVKSAGAYPGGSYVEDSPRAGSWTAMLGSAMHEVLLETETYTRSLVFYDLIIDYTAPPNDRAKWGTGERDTDMR